MHQPEKTQPIQWKDVKTPEENFQVTSICKSAESSTEVVEKRDSSVSGKQDDEALNDQEKTVQCLTWPEPDNIQGDNLPEVSNNQNCFEASSEMLNDQ